VANQVGEERQCLAFVGIKSAEKEGSKNKKSEKSNAMEVV